jgi:hypothetical protein
MLQWAKIRTAEKQQQVVPCRAGILNAVVYSNGDVSVCESHSPLGNLRERSFNDIWSSPEAQALRTSIANRECSCTNEVFLWPSIVYQPYQLVRGMVGGRVWRKTQPLKSGTPSQPGFAAQTPSNEFDKLVQIQARDSKG